jgi:uncharacterized protein (DUF2384 family)
MAARDATAPHSATQRDSILRLAERVLGDPEKAARWLNKPASVLAGETPASRLDSEEGVRRVTELLGQIAHGMFI